MNKFNFNPANGLLDTSAYPTNPSTEAAARSQIQAPLNQIKEYLNLFLDDFTFLKSTNGYTKLPNGFIIQWGTLSNHIDGVATLPISFPNLILTLNANIINSPDNWGGTLYLQNVNNSQFRVVVTNKPTNNYKISWIAMGY